MISGFWLSVMAICWGLSGLGAWLYCQYKFGWLILPLWEELVGLVACIIGGPYVLALFLILGRRQ